MTTISFKRLLTSAAFAGAIVWTGVALAQATSTAPRAAAAAQRPASPPTGAASVPQGPAIAGLCVFSRDEAVGTSAVGKSYLQRIQQLEAQANAELTADRNALAADAQAFDAKRATLATDVQQQQALALNQRQSALQRKLELRQREMEATNQKALGRVYSELQPLMGQVYAQHGCSVLFDAQAVMNANNAMDITPEIVRLLDAKITTFPFEREHLEQPQTAAPAAQSRTQ